MQKVKICIAVILFALTIPILISGLRSTRQELPKEHEFTVKCRKCGHEEVMAFEKIEDVRCSKCKGEVGYLWYCFDCYKSFPHVPHRLSHHMTKDEMVAATYAETCPFCHSINIDYIGVGEYRRVNGPKKSTKTQKKK